MIKPTFILLLSLWALALAPVAMAQVVSLAPLKPQVGEMLTITYNPKASGAKLTADEDVYAIGQIYFPERKSIVFKMGKVGDAYQREFKAPADLNYIHFFFRTVNAIDREADVETMLYRADGEPVRNAYLSKLISRREYPFSESGLFRQELDLYPDNYAAYVYKWDSAYSKQNIYFGPSIEDLLLVNEDLELIEKEAEPHSTEYQYAKAMSSVEMKNSDEFMAVIKQMLTEHEASPLTWTALELFLDRARSKRETSEEVKALERIQWELIQHYPYSQIARDRLRAFAWSDDFFNPKSEFPSAGLEQIADQWIEDEPDNPFPRIYLARLYYDREQKSERALELVEQALPLYEDGRYQLYMNSEKFYATENLLADGFLLSARLHFRLQKLPEAFVRVKAARMHYQESPFKQIEFKTYALEARILQAQSNLMAAETAYLTAWINGYDEAEAGLKEIYQKRKGTLDGFAAYLRGKRDELFGAESAPAFNVTTLGGQKLDLEKLKGKVVVLNFWSTGCDSCEAEIAGLNRDGKLTQRITYGGVNRLKRLRALINYALY